MIPIPPLDGSRVVTSLLSNKLAYQYNKLEPYGLWIVLALLYLGIFKIVINQVLCFWQCAAFV